MEPSIRLMAEVGNEVLGIGAVGRSVFGDDPAVVFRREGRRLVPDLRFAKRYLAMYDRIAGPPRFLALNVWSYGMYQRGAGRDGGRVEKRAETIPVVELRDGRLVPIEMPIYGQPGTEAVWKQVIDGLRAVLADLGWDDTRLLLGTCGDTWASEATVSMFRRIAPQAQWRVLTHGGGCPHWGLTDADRTQPNGMVVGYLEIARRLVNGRLKLSDHPVPCNVRDKCRTGPFDYRSLTPITTIGVKYDGICWKGIDYWPFTEPDGTRRSALNTYVHFGNMVGSTPRAMAAPGERGAVATIQFELLRAGIQETEAMLAIQRLARGLDRNVPHDVVQWTLHDALLVQSRKRRPSDPSRPPRETDLKLVTFYRDGERHPTVRVRAGGYTTGVGLDTVKLTGSAGLGSGGGRVELTLGPTNWVEGDTPKFTFQVTRRGDEYVGTYTGVSRGEKRAGQVTGTLTRRGLALAPAGTPAPSAELRATEAAVGEMVRMLQTSIRTGGGGDYRRQVARLYAAAADATRLADQQRRAGPEQSRTGAKR
jgi:hypothetical protein